VSPSGADPGAPGARRRRSQPERSARTRAALVDAATTLFAERGYGGVALEEVVRAAGVTRGALYHHFAGKRELFLAVFEAGEQRMVERVGAAIADLPPSWERLVTGIDAFLAACEDPAFSRIALIEAPGVLGWSAWREVDARYGLGLVTFALQTGVEEGVLKPVPVAPLAHVLLGALGEAGLMLAGGAPREEVRSGVLALLEGLRA
jgi:AcrR family transcriptional regulator